MKTRWNQENTTVLGFSRHESNMTGESDSFLVGSGRLMSYLRKTIARIAKTSETVLISGENGTGKELVARMIHGLSDRSNEPWVTLNCPALSVQLMESELFGHKKGAFTGAELDRIGRFEMADRGTILLDEISEIAPNLQSKLLRVLQERTFEPVGSNETVKVDVRVIATTNRQLDEEIETGRFREDLFYRLAVLTVEIPSLRNRLEDIPELVEHFIEKNTRENTTRTPVFTPSAIKLMQSFDWPGNVRQLENLVKRTIVFCDSNRITADDIQSWLFPPHENENIPARIIFGKLDPQNGMMDLNEEFVPANELFRVGMSLAEVERRLIELTLKENNGHRAKTAKMLGIGLRTLTSKIKQYSDNSLVQS